MEDNYFEHIVARDGEKQAGIARLVIIIVALLLFYMGVRTGLIHLFLAAIVEAALGFYFVVPQFYVEYEYLYMSRELTVDKIINRERRKRMGSWELTGMESMSRVNAGALAEKNANNKNVRDFTSGQEGAEVYLIELKDRDNTRIYFEPNEEMLRAIKSQFPRQTQYV